MIKRTSKSHIQSILSEKTNWKILDIGCGYSANEFATTICDVQDLSEFYKEKNFIKLENKSLPFKDNEFDFVIASHVLEHVEDDVAFLSELVDQRLSAGGQVLVSVPAWPMLFSSHDTHLKHFRRYTPKTGRQMLEASGLKVVQSGGLFHSLLLPRAMGVLKEKMSGPQPFVGLSQWRAGPLVTGVIQAGLSGDNWMTRTLGALGLSLPGLSWWALCQK